MCGLTVMQSRLQEERRALLEVQRRLLRHVPSNNGQESPLPTKFETPMTSVSTPNSKSAQEHLFIHGVVPPWPTQAPAKDSSVVVNECIQEGACDNASENQSTSLCSPSLSKSHTLSVVTTPQHKLIVTSPPSSATICMQGTCTPPPPGSGSVDLSKADNESSQTLQRTLFAATPTTKSGFSSHIFSSAQSSSFCRSVCSEDTVVGTLSVLQSPELKRLSKEHVPAFPNLSAELSPGGGSVQDTGSRDSRHEVAECSLCITDVSSICEFENLNSKLRRHGFKDITRHLEPLSPAEGDAELARSQLVVDGRSIWTICAEVLAAYEERGRRLRDALLNERTSERQVRDTRVHALLKEKSRLEGAERARDSELANMALRVRTAETQVRNREKELERARLRLEQVLAGAPRHSIETNKKATDNKHSESTSLQSQLCQEQSISGSIWCEENAKQNGHRQNLMTPEKQASSKALVAELQAQLSFENARCERANEQIFQQRSGYQDELKALGEALRQSETQTEKLEAERRVSKQEPSAAEVRLQREVLRLRDELANVRDVWRHSDTRMLMRRDKELRRRGLDVRTLHESFSKTDVMAILIDLCCKLGVEDLSQITAKITHMSEMTAVIPRLEEFVYGVARVLEQVDPPGTSVTPPTGPPEVLKRLEQLSEEVLRMRKVNQAGPIQLPHELPSDNCSNKLWKDLADELQIGGLASKGELCEHVTRLTSSSKVVDELLDKMQCSSARELPERIDVLLQLCNECSASHRVVEALQKLLRVESVAEVLPALKPVLNVSVLRQRASCNSRDLAG